LSIEGGGGYGQAVSARRFAWLWIGCAACASTSGALPAVRARATTDLDCPEASIVITERIGGRLEAVGCGRKAGYRAACIALSCEVRGEADEPIPDRDRPDPNDLPPRR
jgi:hypothetical protein